MSDFNKKLEDILKDFDLSISLDATKYEDATRPTKDREWFFEQANAHLKDTVETISELFLATIKECVGLIEDPMLHLAERPTEFTNIRNDLRRETLAKAEEVVGK